MKYRPMSLRSYSAPTIYGRRALPSFSGQTLLLTKMIAVYEERLSSLEVLLRAALLASGYKFTTSRESARKNLN